MSEAEPRNGARNCKSWLAWFDRWIGGPDGMVRCVVFVVRFFFFFGAKVSDLSARQSDRDIVLGDRRRWF
jgi:hypothetical protein